jgi:hypothetical protein
MDDRCSCGRFGREVVEVVGADESDHQRHHEPVEELGDEVVMLGMRA